MTKNDVNVFDWLIEKGFLNQSDLSDDKKENKERRKRAILWLKRNLPEVILHSPKRGTYRANSVQLEKEYKQLLTQRAQSLNVKKQAAEKLNVKNQALKIENERRTAAGEASLSGNEAKARRDAWFKTPEALQLIATLSAPTTNPDNATQNGNGTKSSGSTQKKQTKAPRTTDE